MRDQYQYYRWLRGSLQPPVPALPTCLPHIRRALSDPRLEGFRTSPAETDLDLLTRYAWNMALAAAMQPTLHLLEVALRNTLYDALTHHHGGDPFWYRLPHAWPPQLRSVAAAQRPTYPERKVASALREVNRRVPPRSPDEPGRVVAELRFGFWTSLIGHQYGSPRSVRNSWSPLWPTLLPVVFPNFGRTGNHAQDRATLSSRLDELRQLRNRISHHEPIWRGRPRLGTAAPRGMLQDYQDVEEAIGWISQELLYAARALSTVIAIHHAGPGVYRATLLALP